MNVLEIQDTHDKAGGDMSFARVEHNMEEKVFVSTCSGACMTHIQKG